MKMSNMEKKDQDLCYQSDCQKQGKPNNQGINKVQPVPERVALNKEGTSLASNSPEKVDPKDKESKREFRDVDRKQTNG